MATDLLLERGCRIELEIAVPGDPTPKPVVATVAHCTRDKGTPSGGPAGLGIRFLADTVQERDRISGIVMSTLTLDLLDFGYKKRKKPAKIEAGTVSHPIPWKRPAVRDSEDPPGPTEVTLRPRTDDPPRANDQPVEDLCALWNLDEVLLGLTSPDRQQ